MAERLQASMMSVCSAPSLWSKTCFPKWYTFHIWMRIFFLDQWAIETSSVLNSFIQASCLQKKEKIASCKECGRKKKSRWVTEGHFIFSRLTLVASWRKEVQNACWHLQQNSKHLLSFICVQVVMEFIPCT